MPRIDSYVAQVSPEGLPPTRTARGQDFGNAGLEQFGQDMGQSTAVIQEAVDREDVTNVRVAMAKARAEWDVNFQQRAQQAQPGDASFPQKFSEDLTDYLGKARGIAQTKVGQQAFDGLAAQLSANYTEKLGAWQVQSAGAKAKLNWQTSVNAYGSSLMTDPSQYGQVRAQAEAELSDPNGQYGRIDPTTRAQLVAQMRDHLARSYVLGIANNGDPQQAKSILMTGRLDDQLDPATKEALITHINASMRAQRVDALYADAEARRAQAQANEDGMNDWLGKIEKGKGSAGAIVNDDRLTPAAKENLIGWMERRAKGGDTLPQSDPAAIVSMQNRMALDASAPGYLSAEQLDKEGRAAVQSGKLTLPDLLALERQSRELAAGTPVAKATAQAKSIGARVVLGINPTAAAGAAAYQQYVDQAVEAEQHAGRDPMTTVLNPQDKAYVGNRAQSFVTGAGQQVAAQADAVRAAGGVSDKVYDVASDADYAKLPPGARFKGPDGKIRVKPGDGHGASGSY